MEDASSLSIYVVIMDNKSGFSLLKIVSDYNIYLRSYIINNIPKVHNDIRIHLLDESYHLTKNIMLAGYNKGNIRMKYLIDVKVNISLIDMFISFIRDIDCVSNKYLNSLTGYLANIKNIIYGWIINEEKNKN